MKKTLFLLFFTLFFHAPAWCEVKTSSPHVINEAGLWLTPEQEEDLRQILEAFEKAKGTSVKVALLAQTEGSDLSRDGLRLKEQEWPSEEARNNSVLFLIAPSEGRMRIEVGERLKPLLPPEKVDAILKKEVVPLFESGRFDKGIRQGSLAILHALLKAEHPVAPEDPSHRSLIRWVLIITGVFAAIFLLTALMGGEMTIQSGNRVVYRHRFSGKYAELTINLLQIFIMGWFMRSGGEGGFLGSGGRFGGGGASGEW
ncbi:MAG: TPM domain-containing protein [bacterium]